MKYLLSTLVAAVIFFAGLGARHLQTTWSGTANVKDAATQSSPKPAESKLSIMIGGDVMFDRNVRKLGEQYGYDSLLSSVSSLFKQADIVAVNLEGPITSNPSKTLLSDGSYGKELLFTFPIQTAQVLKNAGVTLVSLANNHTDNFGPSGLVETRKWLNEARVDWFGDPWNSISTEKVISKNNINVAFVGYHAFQNGFDRVIEMVKRLSADGNFVIVIPHWGEEYVSTSSELMKSQARILVAAGADAIIGSHPHVVMDHEWIGAVPVFYSLGNLLFDQYFSAAVMRGNIVELNLMKNGSTATISNLKIYETSTASRRGVTLVR